MTVLKRLEEYADSPGRLSRRTFLGRTAKVSAAVAGLGAASAVFAEQAYAADCCNLCSTCCGWTYPCASNYQANQCPSGCGAPYTWTCTSGNCTWVCGECCPDFCAGAGCAAACKCSFSYMICRSPCFCPQGVSQSSVTSVRDLYAMPTREKGTCH